jgi:two-component system, NtrC family, sensor kinase
MTQPRPSEILTLAKRLAITAEATGFVLHAVLIATVWGRWGLIGLLVPVAIVAAGVNLVIGVFVQRRIGQDRGEDLRAAFNVAIHSFIGVICDWSYASWLFVPFVASLASIPPARRAGLRLALILVAFDTVALSTGATIYEALAFSGIAVFVHFIIAAYLAVANNLLIDRDKTLARLREAQGLLVTHERLAGIGQVAAGVAHEINNPMCFVTANVTDMLDELRARDPLPEWLVPYRDTILPDAVRGIARVNAIVDDLRRYGRGEPETASTFDLAAEVETAVRMAKIQLKPAQQVVAHAIVSARVEGTRRQIGQVIFDLIVHALHAAGDRAEVRVAMAISDGEVVVDIADSRGVAGSTQAAPIAASLLRSSGPELVAARETLVAHRGDLVIERHRGGIRFELSLPVRAGD